MTTGFPHPASPMAALRAALVLVFVAAAALMPLRAEAADRGRIQAFLEVTGFDVALDSIALSAADAPAILGMDAGDFGPLWTRLTAEVFDKGTMRELALGILEQTLDDDMLTHAADFYASDLGQRLVAAENAAHRMADDAAKQAEGGRLVADMVAAGSPRLELLRRMNRAIDASGTGVRALQEIQFRFLLAASAAGVIELRVDPEDLRAMMRKNQGDLRLALQRSGLAASAYAYSGFSDPDVAAYVVALEDARMQRVYELLNAVQYEIMANRFEALAVRMAGLGRGQDL